MRRRRLGPARPADQREVAHRTACNSREGGEDARRSRTGLPGSTPVYWPRRRGWPIGNGGSFDGFALSEGRSIRRRSHRGQ